MRVEISEQPLSALGEYAKVPISFDVSMVLDVAEQSKGVSEFILTERSLNLPYLKDYDSIDGKQPQLWAKRFDLSNWGMFMAQLEGRGVGCCLQYPCRADVRRA
jgi:hypothetical protein